MWIMVRIILNEGVYRIQCNLILLRQDRSILRSEDFFNNDSTRLVISCVQMNTQYTRYPIVLIHLLLVILERRHENYKKE